MPFLDAPDTIIAEITAEARSILARAKTGDVVYKHLGWQMGRGGYQDEVVSATSAAQTITILTLPADGDHVILGGVDFTAKLTGANGTTQFGVGGSRSETAQNLRDAINRNATASPYFFATASGTLVTVTSLVNGAFGNFVTLATSGSWASLGGNTLAGGFGTSGSNPVKITPFVDIATEAVAVIEVVGNNFNSGDAVVVNGVFFAVDIDWTPGPTLAGTAQNIAEAIRESRHPKVARILTALVDVDAPTQVKIKTLITGEVANCLPTVVYDLGPTDNLDLLDTASGGKSTTLQDPAYPVPPNLAFFVLPDGKVEQPSSSSVSFVCRVPEGASGVNGYGELGIWAEVTRSNFSPEVGEFLVLQIVPSVTGALEFTVRYHGLKKDQEIYFLTTGTLPRGVLPNARYYVQNPTEDTFEISTIPDGASLPVLDQGAHSGTHTLFTGLNRKFLFAHAHFPLQCKNDRTLLTYRIVVNF